MKEGDDNGILFKCKLRSMPVWIWVLWGQKCLVFWKEKWYRVCWDRARLADRALQCEDRHCSPMKIRNASRFLWRIQHKTRLHRNCPFLMLIGKDQKYYFIQNCFTFRSIHKQNLLSITEIQIDLS